MLSIDVSTQKPLQPSCRAKIGGKNSMTSYGTKRIVDFGTFVFFNLKLMKIAKKTQMKEKKG